MSLIENISLNRVLYFCRRSPKEASCDVSLNLASYFRGDVL